MRMSDWSSDVCSSDLWSSDKGEAFRELGDRGMRGRARQTPGSRARAAYTRPAPPVTVGGSGPGGDQQHLRRVDRRRVGPIRTWRHRPDGADVEPRCCCEQAQLTRREAGGPEVDLDRKSVV